MVKMLLKQERWADTYVEDRRAVLARARNAPRDGETMPTKEHVRDTRVAQLREAALLAEVERDVAHVRLNVAERKRELVVVLVLDGVVRRELDEVVRLHGDDVGEDVAALEREVLDDEVELIVGVLDTRDGDVADLEGGKQGNRYMGRRYEPAPQASEG